MSDCISDSDSGCGCGCGSSIHHHREEKYEVFISFRGEDLRRKFLSHLLAALKRKQIHAFMDENLERAKDIRYQISQIIEESNLSVVVFSENYPKSEWCLEELEKIHECMKRKRLTVIPIFYEIDPSDVQLLKGNYAIQLQNWRDALLGISNLSGFDSNNFINEANLIDEIIYQISIKLRDICPSSSYNNNLFGIDSRIKELESLLCLQSNDVRMIGIWGMGGMGKTLIASQIFHRIMKNFDGSCFVSNVREALNTKYGPTELRDKIIHEILGDNDIKMNLPHLIEDSIRRRLKRIKLLLVLDDVDTYMQLKSLLEDSGLLYSSNSFHLGSRMIVTSRDSRVLEKVKNIMRCDIYRVPKLNDNEALQLFSSNAFGQISPPKGYKKLSKKAVQFAHGIPLALVVLGSELKHETTRQRWKHALRKFETNTPSEIMKILKVSFDGLDVNEKIIFLRIASSLSGNKREYVEKVLEAYRLPSSFGLNRLIEKSLIIEEGGRITIHDLLKQMGQEILMEEIQNHQQSGNWLLPIEGNMNAFINNKGTENFEANISSSFFVFLFLLIFLLGLRVFMK